MRWSIYLLLMSINFSICGGGTEVRYATIKDIEIDPADGITEHPRCNDPLNYIPEGDYIDHLPVRNVKVNFHVMRKSDGTGCFSEKEMPEYVEGLLWVANKKIIDNNKMHLPLNNNTPVLSPRYQYKLYKDPNKPGDTGIYYHDDDELAFFVKTGKNRNNYKRDQFEKYGNNKGDVVNVFVMAHHPDSIASPYYKPTLTGIAFNDHVKIAGMYHHFKDTLYKNGKPHVRGAWYCHGIVNHEIGHTLGLRHSWQGKDGCDDTPSHTNCFAQGPNPPCNQYWSNNVMDYNTHQNAWTPCQIGTIHYNFANKKKPQRKIVEKTWCELKPEGHIHIRDRVDWSCAKDLEGNITIYAGGSLTVYCRLALPKGAKITVHPGGKLILDGCTLENDCGQTWRGIEVWKSREGSGQIIMRNEARIMDADNPII